MRIDEVKMWDAIIRLTIQLDDAYPDVGMGPNAKGIAERCWKSTGLTLTASKYQWLVDRCTRIMKEKR